MHVVAGSYWDVAREALEAVPRDGGFSIPGHAGSFETSLMLHLDPELVRTEHIPVTGDTPLPAGLANVTEARDGEFLGDRPTGVSDDASHGTAELGRQYRRRSGHGGGRADSGDRGVGRRRGCRA